MKFDEEKIVIEEVFKEFFSLNPILRRRLATAAASALMEHRNKERRVNKFAGKVEEVSAALSSSLPADEVQTVQITSWADYCEARCAMMDGTNWRDGVVLRMVRERSNCLVVMVDVLKVKQ